MNLDSENEIEEDSTSADFAGFTVHKQPPKYEAIFSSTIPVAPVALGGGKRPFTDVTNCADITYHKDATYNEIYVDCTSSTVTAPKLIVSMVDRTDVSTPCS